MADSLRRLINNESCRILQEKLENWYKDYHVSMGVVHRKRLLFVRRREPINSCDQNLNRCCEIIEMNSMIQGQLFTILNQTAREGGHYAGVETIKSRLLPWLGTCFSSTTSGRPFETSLSLIQESIEKERQLREFASTRKHEIQQLEKELNSTHLQLNLVQQDLAEAQMALEETKTKSATTLLAAEDEIVHLKAALKASQAQEESALRNLDRLNDYEQQVQILKDEITILGAQKSVLHSRLARSRSPSPRPCRSRSPSPLPLRSCSPGRARLTNAARHAHLVARFSDIYAQERLDAQTLLRTYIDDLEIVQKIIYVAAVEVIRAMNINPKISFPPEVDFIMISSLIRELCRVAFSMQTLVPPLDIAFGADGELFNESKYRRSYDSDFTAPLVVYHVWPALMENDSIIVKGEAVSKRGALTNTAVTLKPVMNEKASDLGKATEIVIGKFTILWDYGKRRKVHSQR
ncbi:Mitochondria-eating protein [Chelonia mydas]|uniref:Mitochondria-eating protein n=1 Tax=Chelonia mydas TaxID=8469 RepID=M7AKX0_CHEMY|nr:Mitochondria-eating protein [Chelonia mydas]